MKRRLTLAMLALALLLGGSAVLPSKASAQDASTDASKRKVKTRVVPEYPQLAKQMNVTGKVKIEATIAADGHVLDTKVVGGSPLLVNAAMDALRDFNVSHLDMPLTPVKIWRALQGHDGRQQAG